MPMTERHNEPVSGGQAMSTGEFRAARDISASTAQFRAFAEEGAQADWEASAPARSPAKVAMLIALVIVVLAIFAIIAVLMKAGG
jgi:hypothetical protein